jgi:hypothetical protein
LMTALFAGILFMQKTEAQQNAGPVVFISNNKLTSAVLTWPGGQGFYNCVGTWAGATVTLNFVGADGTTQTAVGASTTLSANGFTLFTLPRIGLQAVVTGAGATTIWCTAWVVPNQIT